MKITKLIKKLKKYPVDKEWLKINKLALKEKIERDQADERLLLRDVFKGRVSAYKLLTNKIKSMPAIIPLLLIFSLVGGGTVYASQGSMPEDALYPVKLATENVVERLVLGDDAKVDVNLKFANRRLNEIKFIASEDATHKEELTKKTIERFEKRVENATKIMEKIKDQESSQDKKMIVYRKFEKKISDYQEVFGALNEYETPKVFVEGDGEADNNFYEIFKSIKEAQKNIVEKENYIDKKIIEITEGEGKWSIPEDATDITEERVEGKINAAANEIGVTEKRVDELKEVIEESGRDPVSIADFNSIISHLDKAKNLLRQAQEDLKKGNYLEALDKAKGVMQICIDVQILIAKEISQAPQQYSTQGKVLSISDESFIIEYYTTRIKAVENQDKYPLNQKITIKVTEDTKLIWRNKKISFSDLNVGDSIRAWGKYGAVVKYPGDSDSQSRTFWANKVEVVKSVHEFTILGSVKSIDVKPRSITVKSYTKVGFGDEKTIYISPDADIIRFSKKVDVGAIQLNDFASFEGYYDKEKDVLVALTIHIPVIVN